MIKTNKAGDISYTENDTFKMTVYPEYEGALNAGSQLRFIIAQTEESEYIIDKTIDINDDLTFTITLTSNEKSKLNLGEYIYKMVLIKNNTIVTQKSGYFNVEWGAAEGEVEIYIGGDGLSSAERKALEENTKARHTHSNKSVLDGITSKDIFNWNNGTEIQMRKYYDEPFDKISDVSLFEFTLHDDKMTATAQIKYDKINEQGITELVIPYEYVDDNKTYLVTNITNGTDMEEVGAALSVKKIIIPNTIINIGSFAFMGCSNVTGMHIPNSVMSIGHRAFMMCTGLINITIGDSVISIGNNAFYGCRSLKSITIPNSVTSIEYGTFQDCSSLISVTIPYSVTSIEDSAFYGCSSLEIITIPDRVTNIGMAVFRYCSSLTSIIIPGSVIAIGGDELGIFYGCDKLTIRCYKNSVAEEYCIANDIPYELLDIDVVTDTAEPIDDVITLTLKSQQELRLGNLTGNYALYLPLSIPKVYESYWTFTAGEGLSLRYSDLPILWRGDDCGSDGYFEPVTGRMYEVILKKINDKTLEDGTIEPVIVARVGAI